LPALQSILYVGHQILLADMLDKIGLAHYARGLIARAAQYQVPVGFVQPAICSWNPCGIDRDTPRLTSFDARLAD
jgi:hypothetical protein